MKMKALCVYPPWFTSLLTLALHIKENTKKENMSL